MLRASASGIHNARGLLMIVATPPWDSASACAGHPSPSKPGRGSDLSPKSYVPSTGLTSNPTERRRPPSFPSGDSPGGSSSSSDQRGRWPGRSPGGPGGGGGHGSNSRVGVFKVLA
jgi:hypothetical protein